jgi:hypothetical protein
MVTAGLALILVSFVPKGKKKLNVKFKKSVTILFVSLRHALFGDDFGFD